MDANCVGVAVADHDVVMCVGCPVTASCQSIYDEFMDARHINDDRLEGVWGGHEYRMIPGQGYFVDDARLPSLAEMDAAR